jgi:hypothetical protein
MALVPDPERWRVEFCSQAAIRLATNLQTMKDELKRLVANREALRRAREVVKARPSLRPKD